MKSFVRAFIPSFFLFAIFARVTKLDDLHRHLPGAITEISLHTLMLYFSYMAPVIYAIMFLTQLLIVLPLYDKAVNNFKMVLVPAMVASTILSAIISYIAWDSMSVLSLLRSFHILFSLQAVYWVANIILLSIVDRLMLHPVNRLH